MNPNLGCQPALAELQTARPCIIEKNGAELHTRGVHLKMLWQTSFVLTEGVAERPGDEDGGIADRGHSTTCQTVTNENIEVLTGGTGGGMKEGTRFP